MLNDFLKVVGRDGWMHTGDTAVITEAGYGKIVSITMTPHRGMPLMAHSSAARAGVPSPARVVRAARVSFHGCKPILRSECR